jgi:membrane associated rhomboid family serine protease
MVEIVTLALILANVWISWQGFSNSPFRERFLFHVGPIRHERDYIRLFSSGFLHGDWMHLIFNMYTLYVFADVLEYVNVNIGWFLVLYFGSMLGGNLLALYIHRNHEDYRALGASGAVSGVIFACIAFLPTIRIFMQIPGWIFAIVYTLVTIYGVKSRWGNIGHEAHLGGSIVGVLLAILYRPVILELHPWILLAITLPMVLFLYVLVANPEFLLIPNFTQHKKQEFKTRFRQATEQRKQKSRTSRTPQSSKKRFKNPEDELNYLLDKVQKKGFDQLTSAEKDRLEQLSQELGD